MQGKALIVGLGNPGPQYAATRHNIGFMLVDHLLGLAAGRKSMRPERLDESGDYELVSVQMAGRPVLLAKPLTYMNLSGRAVARICGRHEVPVDNIVAVHDELDLPLGRMKLRKGGSTNGHRGLESMIEHLGGAGFWRLRLGIDRPREEHADISRYVLEPFSPDDLDAIQPMLGHAAKGLDLLFRRGGQVATQHLHTYAPAGEEQKPDSADTLPGTSASEDEANVDS